jgi:hypothetical protein
MTGHVRALVRRVAVTGCAAGLAILALGTVQASAMVNSAKPTINTYKNWDGSSTVISFGCPNTTTYGQTFTAGKTTLNKFTFSWQNFSGTGSMKVRGEVYAWDGAKATGSALFESKPRFISFGDSLFHFETFKTGSVPLTVGHQYVVFASIDKDYEKCKGDYQVAWAYTNGDVYPGGGFVYQNNTGDESQWTSAAWSTFGGGDIAFKVYES